MNEGVIDRPTVWYSCITHKPPNMSPI